MNRVMIVVDISNLKNNCYENTRSIILFEESIRNNQNKTEACSRNRHTYQLMTSLERKIGNTIIAVR